MLVPFPALADPESARHGPRPTLGGAAVTVTLAGFGFGNGVGVGTDVGVGEGIDCVRGTAP
jgi:hypothetical protein